MNPTIEPILVDMDVSVEEYEFDSSTSVDVTLVRPIITVTDIPGGHRVTVEDVGSTQSFDVMDGEVGFSPSISVIDIPSGHRVTVQNESGTESFDVMNGADGFSPTVSVSSIPNGHRLTITDVNGTRRADIMNGVDASVFYGVCHTDAYDAEKEVLIEDFTSNDLVEGVRVTVKFDYGTTLQANDMLLNVSDTGAYPITLTMIQDPRSPSEIKYPDKNEWCYGEVLEFVFGGNCWVILRGNHASYSSYGVTRLSSAYQTGGSENIAASTAALNHAYNSLLNAIDAKQDVPAGGSTHDILMKRSNSNFDMEWVAPATSVQADNTLPITSGAVYTEIGNINALLATI